MKVRFSSLILLSSVAFSSAICCARQSPGAVPQDGAQPTTPSSQTGQQQPVQPDAHPDAHQDATPDGQAGSPAQTPPPTTPEVPGSLKVAVDGLRQTLDSLRLEKWKGGTVRSEAAANVDSMQKDLQGALPHLMEDADAGPQTMTRLLPLARNVDALYDVLLRVTDGARVAANGEQVALLQQAIVGLDKGRRELNDRMEALAAGQEKEMADLHAAVKAQTASPVCPVVAPTPPSSTSALTKKTIKKKPKPAAKPSTSQPAPAQPATSQPPSPGKPNQ